MPALAALLVWAQLRSDALISRIVAPRLRDQLASGASRPLRILRACLLLLALTAAILALARPQKGYIEHEVRQDGRDIIIAMDVSKSMLATDLAPTRLERAKLFAYDLIKLVPGDRVGLIAFAGSAFLQTPLTQDRTALSAAIDELDTDIIPRGGTNIAEAIRLAQEAFGKGEGHTRALVILTDGEELEDDVLVAARKAEGIRIFTVGVGTPEGSLIPVRDAHGRQDFVRDQAGKPVTTKLDTAKLTEIARITGGFYTPLGADTANEIYRRGILEVERIERESLASRTPIERYQWPLGAAIASLVLWMLVGERRRRAGYQSLMRTVSGTTAAFVLLLATDTSVFAASGVEAYQAGDYAEAAKDFATRLKHSPDSPTLLFNLGATAYKQNNFSAAVEYFSSVLASSALTHAQRTAATYNLANALTRRGETTQEIEAKRADWTSAIDHYETVIQNESDNTQAKENLEMVKKLLEDLDNQQEEQEQDQQQEQNQDDQQQQQDQQDQDDNEQQQEQKDDQQGEGENNQDQEGEGNNQQEENQQQGEEQDEQEQEGEGNDQQQNQDTPRNQPFDDDQQRPSPTPVPLSEEQHKGEIKAAEDNGKEQQQGTSAQIAEEQEGVMSERQARALLNSLRADEDSVRLLRPTADDREPLRDW